MGNLILLSFVIIGLLLIGIGIFHSRRKNSVDEFNLNRTARHKTSKYQVDYPIAFHTVDIAIVKRTAEKEIFVLLIQKPNEVESGIWRFPGGFVDPTDDSAEAAAHRETKEETGMLLKSDLLYIGSCKIDDKRYRDSDHKIITTFFVGEHYSGDAGQGYDDVAITKWFKLIDIANGQVLQNPVHQPLFRMLTDLSKIL